MSKDVQDVFIGGRDAAMIVGVSSQCLVNWANRNKVRCIRVGANSMRVYLKTDIEKLAASRKSRRKR